MQDVSMYPMAESEVNVVRHQPGVYPLMSKLYRPLIEQAEVVSFDVFDTLLVRRLRGG